MEIVKFQYAVEPRILSPLTSSILSTYPTTHLLLQRVKVRAAFGCNIAWPIGKLEPSNSPDSSSSRLVSAQVPLEYDIEPVRPPIDLPQLQQVRLTHETPRKTPLETPGVPPSR